MVLAFLFLIGIQALSMLIPSYWICLRILSVTNVQVRLTTHMNLHLWFLPCWW